MYCWYLRHTYLQNELIKQSTTPYCIVEIPLLITKESYPFLNKILLVTSQEEMQIARVMTRDNCSQEQALAILSAQPSVALRMNSADEVLHNDAGLAELKKSVDALHKRFLIESAEFSNLNK